MFECIRLGFLLNRGPPQHFLLAEAVADQQPLPCQIDTLFEVQF